MTSPKYIREAQLSVLNGVELYRRRFYLTRAALDHIDFTAESLNMTPSEYLIHLASLKAAELANK